MNQLFPSFNQQITMPQLQMPVQQSMLNPVSVGTQLPKVNAKQMLMLYTKTKLQTTHSILTGQTNDS